MPYTPSGMYWDSRGSDNDPAVLLLEGHTGQLVGWRDDFCSLLVKRGLRVIRMDNRDIGLSRHEPAGSSYEIRDMAQDVVDVIADSGSQAVTLVGQSMGGMIAQFVALEHPETISGLTLFYTTPTLEAIAEGAVQTEFTQPASRDEAIEAFLAGNRPTASTDYPYDDDAQRELAGMMYDRDQDFSGIPRQSDAIRRFADLRPRLGELRLPVALIHGRADALIAPQGSIEIMERVPAAELHLYPGMGHEIVRALWHDYVAVIDRTVRRGLNQ